MDVYTYPVPFCIVKNFLNDEKVKKVKNELHNLEPHLKGPEDTGANQLSVKRKGIFLHEHEYLRGNSGINGIFDKVIDPSFIEQLVSKNWIFEYLNNSHDVGTLISLYEEGDEYKYHKDKSTLSIIYYIFEGEFEGGDFFLNHVKVPIESNSLIIFPSCVHHCVKPISGKGKRWSITNFFNLKSDDPAPPENIFRFRNFCSPYEWNNVRRVADSGIWSHQGRSVIEDSTCKFWNMDLSHDEFFTKTLFEKIPNGPWKLIRVYANGQTAGQNGEFHQDSQNQTDWTFMLYTNNLDPKIINMWGGQTEFETKIGRFSQVPDPNMGILFKSDIVHRGMAPSRYVNALRVTIAWKLKKI